MLQDYDQLLQQQQQQERLKKLTEAAKHMGVLQAVEQNQLHPVAGADSFHALAKLTGIPGLAEQNPYGQPQPKQGKQQQVQQGLPSPPQVPQLDYDPIKNTVFGYEIVPDGTTSRSGPNALYWQQVESNRNYPPESGQYMASGSGRQYRLTGADAESTFTPYVSGVDPTPSSPAVSIPALPKTNPVAAAEEAYQSPQVPEEAGAMPQFQEEQSAPDQLQNLQQLGLVASPPPALPAPPVVAGGGAAGESAEAPQKKFSLPVLPGPPQLPEKKKGFWSKLGNMFVEGLTLNPMSHTELQYAIQEQQIQKEQQRRLEFLKANPEWAQQLGQNAAWWVLEGSKANAMVLGDQRIQAMQSGIKEIRNVKNESGEPVTRVINRRGEVIAEYPAAGPANEGLVITMGEDGKPMYTRKSEAAGQAPFIRQRLKTDQGSAPHNHPMFAGLNLPPGNYSAIRDESGNVVNAAPSKEKSAWQQHTTQDKDGNVYEWFTNPATMESTSPVAKGKIGKGQTAPPQISLSPETVEYLGRDYMQGGNLPAMGMGQSGATARGQILTEAARQAQAAGVDRAEAVATRNADKASLANATKMLDAVSAFEKTASANLDIFLKTAKPIIDSGSPWINKPLRSIAAGGLGSSDLAAYNAARQVALTEIAKVVNNPNLSSVLSDTARKEVMGLSEQNATLENIYAVANILKQDMANRQKYLKEQVKEIRGRLGNKVNIPATPKPAPQGEGPQAQADISVQAPNGKTYTFKTQQEADAFKKAAGIK